MSRITAHHVAQTPAAYPLAAFWLAAVAVAAAVSRHWFSLEFAAVALAVAGLALTLQATYAELRCVHQSVPELAALIVAGRVPPPSDLSALFAHATGSPATERT